MTAESSQPTLPVPPTPGRRRWSRIAIVLLLLGTAAVLGYRYGYSAYLIDRAESDLDNDRPSTALIEAERALAIRPRSLHARRTAATAARRSEQSQIARDHLEELMRLEGTPTESTSLELALLRAQNGEIIRVERQIMQAYSRGDSSRESVLEAMALGYLKVFRTNEAMRVLNDWEKLRTDSPSLWSIRGRAWQRLQAFPKAVDSFQRCLELHAERPADRLRLAECLIEQGLMAEARPHLVLLHHADPNRMDYRIRLADTLQQLGDHATAETILSPTLRGDPVDPSAILVMARIHASAGRTVEAISTAKAAVSAAPRDRKAAVTLHQILARVPGREREAAEQESRIKEIEEKIARFLEVTNRLLPQRPHDIALQLETAELLLWLNRPDPAEGWLLNILSIEPDQRTAREMLEELYRRQGRTTDREALIVP